MRILDRYIGKQVLLGTLYAVAVLGIILVLGNLLREIKPLLVDQKAPLELVLRFALNVLPVSLLYTIPWGFLTAVLLVFGRLSAGSEITSFRVAGVSLVRLSAPVFAIGILFSLISFWLNTNVIPDSKATVKQLIYEQAQRDPKSLLKPGVVQGDFKGDGDSVQKLLIESRDGDWVEGFHFYILPISPDGQGAMTYIHANRAALAVDAENSQLRIKLQDAYFESRNAKGEVEMAFAGEVEPLVIDLKNPKSRKPRPSWMSNEEIRREMVSNPNLKHSDRVKMQVEIRGRYSFSLACLAFAFIAVPLGLQTNRRDSSRGLILSLLIGAATFVVTTTAYEMKSLAAATALLWLPNVACVLIGILLFRRARFG